MDLAQAKRIEKNPHGSNVWIFDCKNKCGNEIRIYKQTVATASGYCLACAAKRRRKPWSIDEGAILRVEEVPLKHQVVKVLVLACSECGAEIRVWPGARNRATGKCRSCAVKHKPFEYLLTNIRLNAKHRGIGFSLTYENLLQFTKVSKCTYCGDDIVWMPFSVDGKQSNPYNLDRLDNTKGYEFDNCVVCCASCNFTRGDRFTHEEFMLLSSGLKEIKKRRKQDP